MWPHWAYLVGGALLAWACLACIAVLIWLKEEHEEAFALVVLVTLFTCGGIVLGEIMYGAKMAKAQRPPAEASP